MAVEINDFEMEPGGSGSETASTTSEAQTNEETPTQGCCGGNVRDKMERYTSRMLRIKAD